MPGWIRSPLTTEQARSDITTALRTRSARFLDLAYRAIYRRPRSPYLALLRHAGCELGDLQRSVTRDGLEATLHLLAAQGVYVRDDEWKGRSPIVRGSLRIHAPPSAFDNPFSRGHEVAYTGGSRGRSTRVLRSLDQHADIARMELLIRHAHGIEGYATGIWATNPIPQALYTVKLGAPLALWAYPAAPLPPAARLAAGFLHAQMSRAGRRLPRPLHLDAREPLRMLHELQARATRSGPIQLFATPSLAVRVAAAAAEVGERLEHVAFAARSEPLTEGRRRDIEASGARVIGLYGSMELTYVSAGCAAPGSADDSHLWTSYYAAITRPRRVFDDGPEVSALLLTGLSHAAPKIGLNVDLGDCADITERGSECCALGGLGLTTHLSDIRGYEKLTGEGVTVARTSIIGVIERTLPQRFGGSSIDYQIAEEIGTDGLTRTVLRAHPRLGALDDPLLRDALLGAIAQGDVADRHMARLWQHLESVVVRREPPLASASGKVLPFHFGRATG
ncbi:MAG: hypothetical protein U0821_25840 [Chloroflexota bacterium]